MTFVNCTFAFHRVFIFINQFQCSMYVIRCNLKVYLAYLVFNFNQFHMNKYENRIDTFFASRLIDIEYSRFEIHKSFQYQQLCRELIPLFTINTSPIFLCARSIITLFSQPFRETNNFVTSRYGKFIISSRLPLDLLLKSH